MNRLDIYNGALLLVGERLLGSLSEEREPRRLLDQAWNANGVRYCLEQAQWHFAKRSARFDYHASFTAEWGFSRAFAKPTDWVITSGVFQDDHFTTPLTDYADEAGYWYADIDQIYVTYISDASGYGGDVGNWPQTFAEFVQAYLASKIVRSIPGGRDRIDDIENPRTGKLDRALRLAKNKSAMTGPVTFPTRGTWARARTQGRSGWRDGGSITQLIG